MRQEPYTGALLQVDLSNTRLDKKQIDEEVMKKYIGGTGLGAKFLYENVPPGIEWNDPANLIFFGSGPFGGTIGGSGAFSLVTKGPQTDGAVSVQSNGSFGAFLRFSGFHAIAITGAANDWVYLYVHDGIGEIRDARHLKGKDTLETEELITEELGLGEHQVSVYSIGPAGENLVRFAAVMGDKGHVAAHGGGGAVMGSKKLKAIVTKRSKRQLQVKDIKTLKGISKEMTEIIKHLQKSQVHTWGTSMLFPIYPKLGLLPIKNLTASEFPDAHKFGGDYYRPRLQMERSLCWACGFHHCHIVTVTEGPYAGYTAEEPEYEGMAAWSSIIGQNELGAAIMLNDVTNRLGMDVNEAGWLFGMLMECYEKGIITKKDTGGIELPWGNAEAVRSLLHKIAMREGFGTILAEGTMRAAEAIGGDAPNIGVYMKTGAAPRGHDHRNRWPEMLDVATGSTSTVDSANVFVPAELMNIPPVDDEFSPDEVARVVAGVKGRRALEDSLVLCTFTCRLCDNKFLVDALNAITGWDWEKEQIPTFGHRVANLLRCFDFRHGRTKQREQPSPRYSSAAINGPGKGISVAPYWDQMRDKFYDYMGWDKETGKPLPGTLSKVGLDELVRDMWPEEEETSEK